MAIKSKYYNVFNNNAADAIIAKNKVAHTLDYKPKMRK